MAKNSVQFQKGCSLPDFMAEYGTEGQCATALGRWWWPDGFVCPGCGDDRCFELHTRQLYQCRGCHRQTSLTAGTLFGHTKLSLRPVARILIEIKADSCSRPNHNSAETKYPGGRDAVECVPECIHRVSREGKLLTNIWWIKD